MRTVAGAVLVLAVVAGCGGGGGQPTEVLDEIPECVSWVGAVVDRDVFGDGCRSGVDGLNLSATRDCAGGGWLGWNDAVIQAPGQPAEPYTMELLQAYNAACQ